MISSPLPTRRLALCAAVGVALMPAVALSQSAAETLLGPSPPNLPSHQHFDVETIVAKKKLRVSIRADRPGEVTWPVIPADPEIEAWILPLHEGSYVPSDDSEWIEHLVARSPLDTTASLSMPWIGLDLGDRTLTCIFENQFDNAIRFEDQDGRLAARVTHEFKANWKEHEFPVTVVLGGPSPIAPALAYRDWLENRGELVSMASKIEAVPRAARLLGAAHVYLWGDGLFAREDVKDRGDWPKLCRLLAKAEANTAGHRVFTALGDEARKAVLELPAMEWPDDYTKGVIAWDISRVLAETGDLGPKELHAQFSDLLRDPATWGDGYSTKMIDAFRDAGLDRLWLGLGGWEGAVARPSVAAYADEHGYLLATYDSYHSIHHPDAHPDHTWPTAQFGAELWETGGVQSVEGAYSTGFKGRGRHLSPAAARPFVERRVTSLMKAAPFTSWFVDCDAYGEFFDDHNPLHPANQRADMLARLDRMAWIRNAFGLVIGSEGGSGYAAPTIHFAHGMMTGVIGWGDPRLRERDSKYFLGTYFPPDGPRVFVQQVPLAPGYEHFHFDPRFRLPLYQTVFHDSVIATHQWGYHSLKFTDQVVANTLLEMLYQVPPLYHLNLREFPRHRDRIVAHHQFFSPLHRETGLMPLTGFAWLSPDRLVQRAVFGDRIAVVVNFAEREFEYRGHAFPPRSAVSVRLDTGVREMFVPLAP